MKDKPRFRGKRAGRARKESELRDIHAKVRGVYRAGASMNAPTGAIVERAKYFGLAAIDETEDTHVIPRKSVTVKQFLAVKAPDIETEPMRARQLDQHGFDPSAYTSVDEVMAKHRMIETTDQRMTWRADRSLLVTGAPGSALPTVKRDGFIKRGLDRQKTRITISEERDNANKIDEILEDAIEVSDPESLE